ncbi:MAG: hypothetical protein AB1515_01145 [Nitrospirota bacterium]
MKPGPIVIRKCSACAGLIAQATVVSGNTLGARFWTDGKFDAPMLPDQPWLVKCPHCAALLWLNEQEHVEELWPYDEDFQDALPYTAPLIQDYLGLLQKGVSDTRRERYLRLRAWWAGNDARRHSGKDAPLSDDEIANLRAFAVLLDESDENDRLMKAETMRELGRYEDATALLLTPFSYKQRQVAALIKSLAARRIPFVREMKVRDS